MKDLKTIKNRLLRLVAGIEELEREELRLEERRALLISEIRPFMEKADQLMSGDVSLRKRLSGKEILIRCRQFIEQQPSRAAHLDQLLECLGESPSDLKARNNLSSLLHAQKKRPDTWIESIGEGVFRIKSVTHTNGEAAQLEH